MMRMVAWFFILLYALFCLATLAGMFIAAIGSGGTTYVYTDNPFALYKAPFFTGEFAIFLMSLFTLELGVAIALWTVGRRTALGKLLAFPQRGAIAQAVWKG